MVSVKMNEHSYSQMKKMKEIKISFKKIKYSLRKREEKMIEIEKIVKLNKSRRPLEYLKNIIENGRQTFYPEEENNKQMKNLK